MRWVKLTLPLPDAGEVVVQDLAVDLEQLRRDGAHRRRGRHPEARLHVLDDARRCAPQRLGGLAVDAGARRVTGAASAGRAAGGGAGAARWRAGAGAGGAAARRGRGRRAAGRVVGEEVAPALGDGLGVLQVLPVQLLDEARRSGPRSSKRLSAAIGPSWSLVVPVVGFSRRSELGDLEGEVERLPGVSRGSHIVSYRCSRCVAEDLVGCRRGTR